MATHNFGPVYHSESPTSMNMFGHVDDNGNYTITFQSAFTSSESYFNYSWTIYVGEGTSNPVLEIPANTIGNNASYSQTVMGKVNGSRFYAWAHCGCDGCANNTSPLVIADINLYIAPSLGIIEIADKTTKSITVRATWNDVNNNSGTKDADVTINLVDTFGNVLATKIAYSRDGSDPVTFDNLTHNSEYIIKATLSDGTTTLDYPEINTITKTLAVNCTDLEVHQYSIIAKFVSTVNNNESYIQSGITRSKCELLNSSNEVISCNISYEDDVNKPANSIVTVSDLVSYTEYNLSYYITDGFNVVSCTVNATTVFPYIRINIDGEYKKAIPYIYTNDEWHMAKGYENQQEFNGE